MDQSGSMANLPHTKTLKTAAGKADCDSYLVRFRGNSSHTLACGLKLKSNPLNLYVPIGFRSHNTCPRLQVYVCVCAQSLIAWICNTPLRAYTRANSRAMTSHSASHYSPLVGGVLRAELELYTCMRTRHTMQTRIGIQGRHRAGEAAVRLQHSQNSSNKQTPDQIVRAERQTGLGEGPVFSQSTHASISLYAPCAPTHPLAVVVAEDEAWARAKDGAGSHQKLQRITKRSARQDR